MERHPAFSASPLHVGHVLPLRVEPAQGRHHVLARPEDADDVGPVGQDRGVHDAVGVERQQGIHVAGGGDAHGPTSEDLADVATVFGLGVHPAPHQLQVRVLQHPLDRGSADAARRPLDHPIRHGLTDPPLHPSLVLLRGSEPEPTHLLVDAHGRAEHRLDGVDDLPHRAASPPTSPMARSRSLRISSTPSIAFPKRSIVESNRVSVRLNSLSVASRWSIVLFSRASVSSTESRASTSRRAREGDIRRSRRPGRPPAPARAR